LKTNEALVSGMEKILKAKIDKILDHATQMDDNEAKILIAYDALKDRYWDKKIPDTETERKTVALKIAEELNNVKKFEAHEKTDRYYDFTTNTYSDTPNENTTIDLNLDAVSLDTKNPAINAFLDKNTELKQSLLADKKNDHLYDIMKVTGLYDKERDKDQTTIRSQLSKQADAEQTKLGQEESKNLTSDNMKLFAKNPDKCIEFMNLLAANKESFNTPTNEDMVDLKKMFMDLITDSYTTKKE